MSARASNAIFLLVLVRFTKNTVAAKVDAIACVRPDGNMTSGEMPRRGILPHEAFHFVVESTLEWRDAFFGHVARGGSLKDMTTKLHSQNGEWSKNTQALQSEALVECLESDQWAGVSDPASFVTKLIATCRRRGVPPPDITAEELDAIRVGLREFGAAWRPLMPGASIERTF